MSEVESLSCASLRPGLGAWLRTRCAKRGQAKRTLHAVQDQYALAWPLPWHAVPKAVQVPRELVSVHTAITAQDEDEQFGKSVDLQSELKFALSEFLVSGDDANRTGDGRAHRNTPSRRMAALKKVADV